MGRHPDCPPMHTPLMRSGALGLQLACVQSETAPAARIADNLAVFTAAPRRRDPPDVD